MLVAFIGAAVVTLVINLASISIVHSALYSQVDTILNADAQAILAASTSLNTSLATQVRGYASVIGAVSVRAPWFAAPAIVGRPSGVSFLRSHRFTNGVLTSHSWRVVTVSNYSGVIVTVAESTRDLSATSAALTIEEALSTAIALALLLILSFWVILNGVRPLDAITKVVRTIGQDDQAKRIEITDKMQGTEFASVAISFNTMLDALTERAARESALSAQLRRFVADAGHELRTPLTVISGYAQVLEDPSLDQARRHEAMSRMTSEISRMGRVVEDLLALARLEARSDLRYESVDVTTLIGDLIEDHRTLDYDEHPVFLVAPASLPTSLDVDLFSRVVVNLLANLRSHTPVGTSATITCHQDRTQLIVSYEDSGPGVSDPSSVFVRFWQANSNRSSSGTGLGMAIAAAAVAAHGGTITARPSKTGGLGVDVTLPLAAITPDAPDI